MTLLSKDIAEKVLSHSMELGASFCDIFVEKTKSQVISFNDSKVKDINSGIDYGIGIRLLYGTKVLYGYTNSNDLDDLIKLTSDLAARDKCSPQEILKPLAFLKHDFNFKVLNGLNNDIDIEQKINFLRAYDQKSRAISEKISQVQANVLQKSQDVEIFNSHGLHTDDRRDYTRISFMTFAEDGNKKADAYHAPGEMSGFELTQKLDLDNIVARNAKLAIDKLSAKPCPAGKMPVVIDNGFGGVIFHEACGHLLETTSVEKKASVFHDQMNQMIANPVVSAYDDGTIENGWGSINIDDEGMKTQRTELIKDGQLTSFLVDYVGELKTGYKRTGSGRRQNYKFAPASRMRNTFIAPGKSNLEEMITSMPEGIYCKQMGGGSVKPGTGEFNFAVLEGYYVKDGKIQHMVDGATLIGSGPEVLKEISMVGDNFEIAAGMCGSVSGAVPTTVGQPALKVDQILVGGQA